MPNSEIAALHVQPIAKRPTAAQPDRPTANQPGSGPGPNQSHIEAIAALLGLSVAQLPDTPAPGGDQAAASVPDITVRPTLEAVARLLRAFTAIKDSSLRERIVAMAEALVAGETTSPLHLRGGPVSSSFPSCP